MASRREELLALLDELDETFETTEAALRTAKSTYRRVRRALDKDRPITEIFDALSIRDARAELTDQLNRFEEIRHRVRTATFGVALEEGITIGQLSRMYGFSRQLAARYAREARLGRGMRRGPVAGRR